MTGGTRWLCLVFVAAIGAAGVGGCRSTPAGASAVGVGATVDADDHGPSFAASLRRFDDGVLVGPMPEGPADFVTLAARGVRTVVSVDAATPDVEAARAAGLRYVHVPVRYAGIASIERLALVKALRTADGAVYVHCHHGVHRGPAAAAYALVAEGRLTADEGVAWLRRCGTSPAYPGLYEAVGTAAPLSASQEAALVGVELPEVASVRGTPAVMARVDNAWGHLKTMRVNGWAAPANHPDLVATAEAGVVADLLRTLVDDPDTATRGAAYAGFMRDAAAAAASLETALVAGDARAAAAAYDAVAGTCLSCHEAYRNEAEVR